MFFDPNNNKTGDEMRKKINPWLAGNIPLLVAVALPAALFISVLVYFAGWAITFSFTDLETIGRKSVNWDWVGLKNYIRLFTRQGFLQSLWVTVIFTFFSAVIGQTIIGFLLAVALRGKRGLLKTTVEVSIMLGWLLPDIVAAFLWSASASQTGLINRVIIEPLGFAPINFMNDYALIVVIIANTWKGSAWSYLLFSAALDAVPKEIIEAAKVDGTTPIQRLWKVVIPMIRPHIATNMLFITIWTFTYFPLIYALTGGGPGNDTNVLAIFLYQTSFDVHRLGYGSAISVAMLLIVGALSIFYLRLLKEPK